MEISIGMLTLLGVTIITVIAFLIYNSDKQISTKTEQFDTGQDNKKYLELVSALANAYEQERETTINNYLDGAFQECLSTKPQVVSEEYSRPELWSMSPIRLLSPSSGATITAQHYTYPETLKLTQVHCKFCGNNFVPDKFGRCSSCGGPQQ